MSDSAVPVLVVERDIPLARQTELGIHGWPLWKDGPGRRRLTHEAVEKNYFLAGSATLTPEGGAPVTVNAGDLVVVPAGPCVWDVHVPVRRHYRADVLTPACCIL